ESRKILENHQLEPVTWSKWFHACSAHGALDHVVDGVDSSRIVTPLKLLRSSFDEAALGFALEQIGAKAIIEDGLTGKGVKIGIIDGGFLGADENASLASIIADGRLKAFRNYLQPSDTIPFGGSRSLDDQHGTEVWELTGGYNAQKRIQFGLATGADYYLARTDHGAPARWPDCKIRALSSVFVREGDFSHKQAASPVITGAENDVPDEAKQLMSGFTKRVKSVPVELNGIFRQNFKSVEPTDSTPGASAGTSITFQSPSPSFPAATTMSIPSSSVALWQARLANTVFPSIIAGV
ncbi:MAG: hypothetical protein RIE59_26335, partial [Imperialibacter sp.]